MQDTQENNQRTDEWFEARMGKFTSSAFHKLMGDKGLGKTGDSYAFELAIEIAEGRCLDESFESFDMQRGTELEPLAFRRFNTINAPNFIEAVKCDFIKLNKDTGGSPDGLIGDKATLEIKCPKHTGFFDMVRYGSEAIKKEYAIQIQHQLWVSGREYCHFMNYDIYNGRELDHTIIVHRDEKIIDLMKVRLKEAIQIRDEHVKFLLANKQY